jgi:hypothetical protein
MRPASRESAGAHAISEMLCQSDWRAACSCGGARRVAARRIRAITFLVTQKSEGVKACLVTKRGFVQGSFSWNSLARLHPNRTAELRPRQHSEMIIVSASVKSLEKRYFNWSHEETFTVEWCEIQNDKRSASPVRIMASCTCDLSTSLWHSLADYTL